MLDMIKGYEWRKKSTMQEYAQLASWISHINFIKKPLDPRKLVPEKADEKRITKTEGNEIKRNLLETFGAKVGEL